MIELYHTWIEKSVNKELADDIIIQEVEGQLAGVITVFIKNEIGYIGLVGVDSRYRGQGIGSKLIKDSLTYFKNKSINRVEVVTQGNNKPACKLYEKHGFSILYQTDFYHFWI